MFSRLLKIFFFICCTALVRAENADALQLRENSPHVGMSLYTSSDSVHNGRDLQIVIKFDIKDGWHILSSTSGDIGLPTRIDWRLPEGYSLSDVRWSRPQILEEDGLRLSVYEGQAYYAATIIPNEEVDGLAVFEAEVFWQACAYECIPETRKLKFSLPVSTYNTPPADSWENIISTAEKTFGNEKPAPDGKKALGAVLAMAFAGGILLNLMPCIFPVLSLKAIALVKNLSDRRQSRLDALLYTAGVVVSFFLMAFVLVRLRKSGEAAGWGFQLQSPVFVGVLLIIFLFILLMFLGIIELNNPFSNALSRLSARARRFSSFFTGTFSVLIATPCTAPFMGIAVGYTLSQPLYCYYPVFLTLGLGYAFPFLLLGFFPQTLAAILPRPGKWMLILQRIFAIPVLLTCIWLSWVLYHQLNKRGIDISEAEWRPYDRMAVAEAVNNRRKVFIDFTAKWCLTCLANEKAIIHTSEFTDLAKENDILLFRADWTKRDEEIARALQYYGRNSIPLYVYYNGETMEILPQLLTPGIIREKLK